MKLTGPQIQELRRLAKAADGAQETGHGRRARVQNSLRSKDLLRMFNADGHIPGVVEILVTAGFVPLYDRCELTPAGREAVKPFLSRSKCGCMNSVKKPCDQCAKAAREAL